MTSESQGEGHGETREFSEPPGVSVVKRNQFSSAAQSCLTLCDPKDCSMPGFPIHHYLPELAQTHVHRVSDAIQPSQPLSPPFLPPLIFPSIRVFSSEPVLHIRWPKYWSFSFSISPSNEYSGLIGFPCSPRDSQESSPTPRFRSINSSARIFLYITLTSIRDYWKNRSFD